MDLNKEWHDNGQVRNMKTKPAENRAKTKELDEME